MKTCKADGIDSEVFEVNLNGIQTVWSLSIRFWTGGRGERMTNPLVLCLNLVSCKAKTEQESTVRYKFGVQNMKSQEWEMGAEEKVSWICEYWGTSLFCYRQSSC